VIRVYDDAEKLIEAPEQAVDFKESGAFCLLALDLSVKSDSAFVQAVAPGFQQWPKTTKRIASRVYPLGDF